MSANTNLVLANPDFDSIEGSLKAFLRSQDQFKDYDFEGSNMATLLNLLAYNTYQNAFMSNMVASEMFLDTAQLRPSVVSHAKELGYTPRSTRSAMAVVNLTITPSGTPGTITVPKGTLFNTQVGSRAYTFTTCKSYVIQPVNDSYTLTGVEIFEGFPLTEAYVVAGTDRERYTISNTRIDTRTLSVTVDGVVYKNATSFLDLTSTSLVYFLQLGHDNRYEIVFGGNIVGREPIANQQIKLSYNVSSGSDANGARVFRPSGTIDGHINIHVETVSPATGGDVAESTESIRRNAPLTYQTRNRAVTTDDYKVLLKQEFPEIQSINVYGGENVNPPQYGRVFISIDTSDAQGASDSLKAGYYRYIKTKCPVTVEPVFTDPSYMLLKLKSTVYYDYVNYDVSADDIRTAVIEAVDAYNEADLADFDRTFLYSRFVKSLDDAHVAILSNDTEVQMILALQPTTATQTLEFHNEIARSNLVTSITSSPFMYLGKTCQLQDDGLGVVRVVTNTTSTPVSLLEVGTVDYQAGSVTINPFAVEQIFGYGIRLYVLPSQKNIIAINNVLLSVDTSEVNITAVPTKK